MIEVAYSCSGKVKRDHFITLYRFAKGRLLARILLFWAILLSMTACTSLPQAELTAYSDSVIATKQAGDLILDEVSAAIPQEGVVRDTSCEPNAQDYRPCFRVDFALGDTTTRAGEHPDIQVRRLALAVLVTYTEILVDISAGRPAEVVAQRGAELDQLSKAVSVVLAASGVPLASLPILGVTEVAKKIVSLSSTTAATTSILQAEEDIRALIQLLINDTPALYRIYVLQFEGNVLEVATAMKRAQFDGKTEEEARLKRKLDALRSPAGNAAKAKLFESAITDYVKLLDRTDKTLVALSDAITLDDLGPIERSTEFVRRATESKILLDDIIKDMRAIRDKDR